MERLKALKLEFDENTKQLSSPYSLADLEQLRKRRRAILLEAQLLAETLNLSGPQWFSIRL
jgi:hypothetical protein